MLQAIRELKAENETLRGKGEQLDRQQAAIQRLEVEVERLEGQEKARPAALGRAVPAGSIILGDEIHRASVGTVYASFQSRAAGNTLPIFLLLEKSRFESTPTLDSPVNSLQTIMSFPDFVGT
jgi:hypothetical protein